MPVEYDTVQGTAWCNCGWEGIPNNRDGYILCPRCEFLDSEDGVPLPKKAGRNDPCPCGSGKKFKKCCA